MHRSGIVSLLCAVLSAPIVQAASPSLVLDSIAELEGIPSIVVVSSDPTGVELEFDLPALGVDELTVDGQHFQIVTIPGGWTTGEVGAPALPTFTRLVAIPDRSGVTITPVIEEEEELTGFRLAPVQEDQGSGFSYDPAAYAHDDFGTVPIARAAGPAVLRELRVIPLTFQPVRYNPARGLLRVARRIRVEVAFTGESEENVKDLPPRAIPPSFDTLYRQTVVNYEEAAGDRAVESGTWVVIAPNDNAVTTRLQPLLEWRKRKGLPVKLATTAETGSTTTAIKNWLQNAYNTWPNPPEYVVLAGDATTPYQIPTFFENLSGYGGEGDHPYVQLEGGDVLADAHIGRLSFSSTTELEAIVNKIIGYESTPYLQDPGWYRRACLVGDPSSSGYSCVQVQQWIKVGLRLNGYADIDTIYNDPFVSQMTTALNRGDTFFSYRGYYGMSGWGNGNTYGLSNGWRMPFVVAITCDTGSFASGTSRSEGFLRANTNATSPKGGIGAVGTATIGTHTALNNVVHLGIFQGLLYEQQYTMGAALTRGKMELYLNYQANDPTHVIIWSYWNNLMGDPAVECWTGFPEALTVSHPASIPIGSNSVTVGVQKGGVPEPNVQVCLYKGSETFVVGLTDDQASIELPVSTPTSGNMLITVTKHNRYPYLASIPVAAQSRFVGYQASVVDDDNIGTSHGNGDAQVNPTEGVELRVQLKNFGSQSAPAVTATLTTEDPYVTILDNQESFGDIAAGATSWSADDFDVAISGTCPAGRTIRLGLDIASGVDRWHSLIDLPVLSADFAGEGTTLYNAGGNGLFDPGETVGLSVKLRNNGQANATNVTGTLTSLSSFLTVLDGSGAFGNINVGASGENGTDRFSVSAAPDTYQGYLATFRLITTFSGGALDTTLFTQTVGQRSSDDPVGPDQYGYYAFDNTDTGYPEAPTYQWAEIDPGYGGSGTQIPLTDFGTYQDDSIVIDLPFTFWYYGQSFTKATVCSNGWMAMGSTYLADYRNWTIPGAGGPKGNIAGFWDDLNLGGGGKVLSYYDTANHRFIVEWSRVRNEPGSGQTFEIILYDPAYYPNPTGDGVILVQYNTVNNTDAGDLYATVGIESPDGFDGLLYTFFNDYASGAATLAAGRAIRFVPANPVPSGSLSGIVQNASYGNAPIAGAEVLALENGRTFASGEDGRYGGPIAAGTYTLVASHQGFAPDTASGVVVQQGQATQVDFALVDILGPVINGVTDMGTTTDTAGPYAINATITDNSAVSSVKLFYRLSGGGWIETPMSPAGGDVYAGSIPGMAAGTQIDYYVWAQDGGGRSSTSPPNAPTGFYTLYITELSYSYAVEDPEDPTWQLGAAGDNASTGAWVRVDPNGTNYNGADIQPENDHTTDPGVLCFVTGQGSVGGAAGENDVDGGCTTLVSPEFDLGQATMAFLSYHRWFGENGNSADDEFAVDITSDGGQSWIALERVPDNDNTWREVTKNLLDYIQLSGQIRIRFVACDLNTAGLVEAAIDDVSLETFTPNPQDAPESEGGPLVFALGTCRPNPSASSGTTIEFSLDRSERVELLLYDIQGRLVRRLLDATRGAGHQQIVWDGRDSRGSAVPSGIYFCRLQAGHRTAIRKLIRIE